MFGHELPTVIYEKLQQVGKLYIANDKGKPVVEYEPGRNTVAILFYKEYNNVHAISEREREEMNRLKKPTGLVGSNKDMYRTFLPDRYIENHPFINRIFIHGIFDCHTLLHDYYSRQFDLWIPASMQKTYGWWDEGEDLYFQHKPDYVEQVTTIKRHDTVLFKLGPVANHAAIALGNNKILHHLGGRFSCVELLNTTLKNSIYAVYRIKNIDELVSKHGDKFIEGENG